MCTFCAVVRGEVASAIVFEDELTLGFLDHRPLFFGHTLLVPRTHHETVADLPEEEIAPYFSNVRILSAAVQEACAAEGSFIAINNRVSQSVPHLHAHIVPRNRKDGLRGFFWPRTRYRDDAHLEEVAGSVRDAVDRVRAGA